MGTKHLGLARDCRSRVVTVEGLLARFLSIFITNRSSSWQNLEITSLCVSTHSKGLLIVV